MMDDELLSAFVDGELSDAELAAVETRLRDDPRARELVAELRAVSETLRSLPRHKLGADLREAVLQQAVTHREPVPADSGSVRRWAWAALAVAAAVLLTVYLPDAGKEKQQLAQAEAKKREVAPPLPRLEAPADKPAEAATLVTEAASAPLASDELREGSVVFEPEADRVAPTADAFAGGRGGGTLGGSTIQSRQVQPVDESSAEAFEVHLTPGDPQVGPAQFDQLLTSHGIALRDESSSISARSGGAMASDIDKKVERRSAGKSGAVEAELVLVEAPIEEIQRIIEDCSGDGSSWKSLRLVGKKNASSSVALLAEEKLKSPSPVETGVAIALDGLHLDDDLATEEAPADEEQPQSFARRQASPPTRGWATHLGRGWSPSKPEIESARNRERSELGAAAQAERHDEPSGPAATIRVLFILHPAAE
jgi:hypothetical protein